MSESLTCDLCEKCSADEGYSLPYGPPTRGMRVVMVCERCTMKIGDVDRGTFGQILASVVFDRQSLNCAIMFATRRTPNVQTDDTFFRGWGGAGGSQFENASGETRDGYLGEARRQGVSTNGKVYMHGLAEYPGDPRAWVSTRGEMKKILEEKGWGCDRLGIKARTDLAPPESVPLADDIVAEFVEQKIQTEGIDRRTLTPKKLREMREAVVETHGQKKPPPETRKRKRKTRVK